MSRSVFTKAPDPLGRVARLSRFGFWISSLALALSICIVGFLVSQMLFGDPEYITYLLEDFEISDYMQTMTFPQTIVGGLLWGSVDFLGVIMLWQVRQLFRGFLRTGVFTEISARLLRRIGLIVLLMGPVSILSGLLGSMLISYWHLRTDVHGSLTIDDSDVYAIVIGLVITAVSHIMLEAARLNQENQAFV